MAFNTSWSSVAGEPGPANALIRRFSDKLSSQDPGDPLTRGLNAKVAVDEYKESVKVTHQQQFNTLLQSASGQIQRLKPDQEAVLTKHYENLQTAWSGFTKKLAKKKMALPESKEPDLKFAFDTLNEVSAKLLANTKDSAGGIVREKCRSLCESIHAHKSVLKILPTDDKHFTLLAGSLTTVMQAAVNYGDIRKQVEETLANLFDELSFWDQYRELIINQEMYNYIVELYVLVFECLTDIFSKWSSRWDRVKASLNEDSIRNVFEQRQTRMKSLREKLLAHITADKYGRDRIEQRYSRQMQQAQARNMEEMLQVQKSIERQYQESLRMLQMQVSDMSMVMSEMRLELGRREQRLLEPIANQQLKLTLSNGSDFPAFQPNPDTPLSPSPPATAVSITSNTEILLSLEPRVSLNIDTQLKPLKARLAKYYAELAQATTQVTQLEIDAAVRARVLTWLKTDKNEILWIEGPPAVPRPSQNTALALLLSTVASSSEFHCVHWFCGISSKVRSKRFNRKERLADMITGLFMQLLMLIPEEQMSDFEELSEYAAHLNDRSMLTSGILQLIKFARERVPASVVFIVDGLQDLEDRSDAEYQKYFFNFVETLASIARFGDSAGPNLKEPRHFESTTKTDKKSNIGKQRLPGATSTSMYLSKICLTSDGYVDVLAIIESRGILAKVSYDLQADDPECDETDSLML